MPAKSSPGVDARIDQADLDPGAVGAGRHGLRRLHLGDAVRRGLRQGVTRQVLLDVFDVGVVAQALQRLRRHGHRKRAQVVETVVHLATGGAQCALGLRAGPLLELDPDTVRIGLCGEHGAGHAQGQRGAKRRSEFLLLHVVVPPGGGLT
jgi:hypothetical protein